MRILFLALDIDLSKQRGDTTHALELASAFRELGHEVTMVVGAGAPERRGTISMVSIRILNGSDRSVLAGIKDILRSFPADVIYERRSTPKIGFAARSRWRIPVVMEINGILREELSSQGRDTRAARAKGVKGRLRTAMFRHIDGFVVVSQAIKDDMVSSHGVDPSKIRVVGNGVNPERFRSIEKADACAALGLSPGRPRIVFVGNLVGWRDFETVLNAVATCRRRIPGLQFTVVGDGPDRAKVEKAAGSLPPSTVIFVGEVPHGQVPEYICAADLCLLPEKVRNVDISPLKLFEYMSCERPIVAFAVKGLELVESIGAGILVPPNEPDKLSEGIEHLIKNPDKRREMGRRGRAFIEKERTWHQIASTISIVLREVVSVQS